MSSGHQLGHRISEDAFLMLQRIVQYERRAHNMYSLSTTSVIDKLIRDRYGELQKQGEFFPALRLTPK